MDFRLLELFDIYKSSLEELQLLTKTKTLRLGMKKIQDIGPKIVLVTKGNNGSTLLFEEHFYDIPIFVPRKIVDPTGAGDTFIGAFLAEYIEKKDPLWCALVGAAASSFIVETIGPRIFGEKKEIYERTKKLFKGH